MAFEIHPNGAIYFPVLLLLFLSELGLDTVKNQGFWGLIAGAMLGGFIYLYLHVIRYPETYININQLAFFDTHIPPILTFNPQIIIRGITSAWTLFYLYMMLLPVVIFGIVDLIIGIFINHTKNDFLLFILTFSLVITYALWIRNKFAYYAIIAAPVLTIVASRFLINTWKTWRGHITDYANRVSWGLTIISIVFIGTKVIFNSYSHYRPVQDRISLSVHDGEVVMGSQTHWFGLHEHQYYSWETIIYYQRLIPGSSFSDVMVEFRPDVFILDGHMLSNYFTEEEFIKNTYRQNLHVPLRDVRRFLENQAQLVEFFESPIYGPIEIYKINWDQDNG